MKVSVKLREEQSPLWKAKLPLTVGDVPLLSCVTLGDPQDLALHIGTIFESGPSCKLAYKPNDPASPLSLILKTGFGLWGSPSAAAVAMTAEFNLAGRAGPFFSVSLKPRIGDFSLRKYVKSPRYKPVDVHLEAVEPRSAILEGYASVSNGPPLLKYEKNSAYIPLSYGDSRVSAQRKDSPLGTCSGTAGGFTGGRIGSLASDTNLVNGSDLSLKTEELVRERKGRGDKQQQQKVEGMRDHEVDAGRSLLSESGVMVVVPDAIYQENSTRGRAIEQVYKGGEQAIAARPLGYDGSFRDWSVNAHTSLPLGVQAQLNIQWCVKVPQDLFRCWDNTLSSFSFSKLPFLLMDKISVESINPKMRKLQQDFRPSDMTGSLDHEYLPMTSMKQNRQLNHITAMCCSMKQRLHILHAENKILRETMEDLGAEFVYQESMGSWKHLRPGDIHLQEDNNSNPNILEEPQKSNEREMSGRNNEGKKDGRDYSRRDSGIEGNGKGPEKIVSPAEKTVSQELKRAIMSATAVQLEGEVDIF